jgi:hypothetical protein
MKEDLEKEADLAKVMMSPFVFTVISRDMENLCAQLS